MEVAKIIDQTFLKKDASDEEIRKVAEEDIVNAVIEEVERIVREREKARISD